MCRGSVFRSKVFITSSCWGPSPTSDGYSNMNADGGSARLWSYSVRFKSKVPSKLPMRRSLCLAIPRGLSLTIAQPEGCDGVEDLSVQENLLHLYSAGVNFLLQPALNEGIVAENVLAHNMQVSTRKKPRVNELAMMAKQQISFAPCTLESERFLVPHVCTV